MDGPSEGLGAAGSHPPLLTRGSDRARNCELQAGALHKFVIEVGQESVVLLLDAGGLVDVAVGEGGGDRVVAEAVVDGVDCQADGRGGE